MHKILIVEDDEAMAVALRDGFRYEGYDVTLAKDGSTGLQLAKETSPDLIILDVMLPKMSGLDVCRNLRAGRSRTPIIMLTARGQEIDKVVGLKSGADDYVTKPFSFMELMARVEALLRRSEGTVAPSEDSYEFGDLMVSFKKHEASRAGRTIDLSPREFRLLGYLVEHRGEVVGREQLLDAVWGYDSSSYSRTVDMHIAKLRRKIEEHPEDPRLIVTVHGVGYKFNG
jgi:two-component system alkaline phosphatase synthesis response regulator PhoP